VFEMRNLAILLIIITTFGCQKSAKTPVEDLPVLASFSAMGCGPYGVEYFEQIEKFIKKEKSAKGSLFAVHVGDIVGGKQRSISKAYYEKISELFKKYPVPFFFVPGDNEWNDLKNPEKGWKKWNKYYLNFFKSFKPSWTVKTQAIREENWSFKIGKVLFLGFNLVGGRIHDPKEWHGRHIDNVKWLNENLPSSQDDTKAAVMFFQTALRGEHSIFTKGLRKFARKYKKPILLVHADKHKWIHDRPLPEKNIIRIQMDKLGPYPPIQVSVLDTDNPSLAFKVDRRLKWLK